MELTKEAKEIIENKWQTYWDGSPSGWLEWALHDPELLAAQGLIYKNGKENIRYSGHVKFTHNAQRFLDELEEKTRAVAALSRDLAEARKEINELEEKASGECFGRELDKKHMEFQAQEIADYRSALEEIAKKSNAYNTWEYEAEEMRDAARSVLDKYKS